ncbi:hypothetical protein [Amycolatopsis sp. NPDC051903]
MSDAVGVFGGAPATLSMLRTPAGALARLRTVIIAAPPVPSLPRGRPGA